MYKLVFAKETGVQGSTTVTTLVNGGEVFPEASTPVYVKV